MRADEKKSLAHLNGPLINAKISPMTWIILSCWLSQTMSIRRKVTLDLRSGSRHWVSISRASK